MTADGPIPDDMRRFPAHRRAALGGDRSIARLATHQHGVVEIKQLRQLGFGERAVHHRVATGRLHRVHQGVYAVGHSLLTREGRWMAAVLACGPEAVLSHRSAAALWGLRQDGRSRVDVTAPGRRGRMPIGIEAHRHGSLRADDRTSVNGIPCTSIARTLLDLAGVVSARELRNAITQAEVLGVFDLRAVRGLIARSRGRRGIARLRRALDEFDPGMEYTRSELERRFLSLCARKRLPRPEVNAPLDIDGEPIKPDFLWRKARLVVETDGRRFHDTAVAFEKDRHRDQQLLVAGWRVVRCTWRQVVDEPAELAQTLRELLQPSR